MKATDSYRKINNSPLKGIILYYTEKISKVIGVTNVGSVIAKIQTGKTPPKATSKYYQSNDVNWFKPSDIGYSKYLVNAEEQFSFIAVKEKKATIYAKETLLMIGIGGGVGRVSILKEEGSSNQQITGLTFKENIFPEYAYYYYLVREDYIKSLAKSMSFPILNQESIKSLNFSYPTIEAQKEFVRFIDNCWESFLANKFPNFDEFQIDIDLKEFSYKQFKSVNLIDRFNNNIKNETKLLTQLKQSIFEDAIQAKLSQIWRKENPKSENASFYLHKIKAEKESLIKQKKIKNEKSLPVISKDEFPFELPSGWQWTYISEIAQIFTGDSINKEVKNSKYTIVQEGLSYIGTKDVAFEMNGINYETGVIIPNKELNNPFKIAPKNSILLCIEGGSSGKKIALTTENVCFGNKLLATIPFDTNLSKYLFFLYNSTYFKNEFKNLQGKGLRGGVSINSFKTIKIPLPPIEELKIIIEKLDDMLKNISLLNKEIETLDKHGKTLMKAMFNETIETKTEECQD